jgi:F5/8 type C domain/Fibronectin type III domain
MPRRSYLSLAIVVSATVFHLILLAVRPVHAADMPFAWDAPSLDPGGPPPSTIAGYKLYYGPSSRGYEVAIDVGPQTAYHLTGLADGQRYYVAVTVYDTEGNESAFSNEVSMMPSAPPSAASGMIPPAQLTIAFVDSEELVGAEGEATHAIDGEVETVWQTEWSEHAPPHPHTIVISLGGTYLVDGFRYLPRQDGSLHGTIRDYQCYVSEDGRNWGAPVATGTLAGDRMETTVTFPGTVGRFVSLVARSEIQGQPWTSAAEITILGTAVPPPTP